MMLRMQDNLNFAVIEHPLRRDLVDRLSAQFVPGISLRDLRDQYAPPTIPVLIHLNGILVPEEKWSITYPLPGDFILFSAALHGDDGKMIFRIVLMIAIAAFAAWAGPALAGAMFGAGTTMASVMGAVFAGVITVVGGLLVNALLPPPAATAPPAPDTALDSPSYSWAPGNTSQQGVPVARWYGKHRIYGNIIGSYLENVGKDQYINSLISLGLGPIDSLGNFKINDEPYQNFNDVTIEARYGHLNQTATSNFKKLKIEYPGSVEVSWGNQHIHTTQGDDFDMLEVDMTLPQGLWATGEGGIAQHEVSFTIEVRKVGTVDWIPIILSGPPTLTSYIEVKFGDGYTAPRWSKGKLVDLSVDLSPLPSIIPRPADPFVVTKWWDLEAGSSTYTDHVEGESAGGEWTWHWCGPVPEEYRDNDDAADHIESVVQAPPEHQSHVITIRAASHNPLRYTYVYKLPSDADKGQYEIRITRQNQNMNDAKYGDRLYYAGCREVWRERYTYPRQVLVSVRAKATDQLSGSLRFSCVGKMALVRVWDGVIGAGGVNIKTSGLSTTVTTVSGNFPALMAVGAEIIANGQQRWVVSIQGPTQVTVDRPVNWSNGGAGYSFTWRAFTIAYSNNPAWVAYDIFTQPVLAGDGSPGDPFRVVRFDGFNPSRIDLPKFKEWADYCDELVPDGEGGTEKRIQFNGGFDFDTSMWEAAFKVAAIGRAVPIWNGVHLTLAIDKPADPVTLFTVGNIEESRFKENFLPMEERATLIEVDYANMENNYDRDKLTVFRPDALTTAYRASMDLFGVTKESQVWRAAMYRLNCNKYLIRTVEIDVDIEAINCQLGDVVYIQHDVPRWGAAGSRIVSATENTVTLDQKVVLEAGLSYKLLIRLAEDVVHEREVLSLDYGSEDIGALNFGDESVLLGEDEVTLAGDSSTLVINPPFDLSADFSAQTAYNVGATVRYAGKIFECIQQTSVPSPLPTDISYWAVTQACPLPQQYDIYAFGQVSNTAKLFRITDISLTQDQKATLTMIEYRPEVYESELAVPSLNDRTQKKLKKLEPTNVVLAPITTTGPRGDVIWGIGITFTESTSPQYVRSHVWYALKTGVKKPDLEWLYAGATTGESFEILGVEENKKYYVVLLPENITGDKLRISNATIHKIVISPHWTGDVRHPFIDGFANVHTSGSSITVTTTNDAFEAVSIGTTLIANKLARLVIAKADNNTVTVNEAVNWDNNGTGYPFEYNPLMSDYLKYLSTVSAQNRLELDQMADDGYISPSDKLRVKQLWEEIVYRGNPVDGVLTLEANEVGADTTAFAAAYALLDDYLNNDLELFVDMTVSTFLLTGDELTPPIPGLGRRNAWDKRWNDYYNAKDDLKKEITKILHEVASGLRLSVEASGGDAWITVVEKAQANQLQSTYTGQHTKLAAQATAFGLLSSSEYIAYDTAYDGLIEYIGPTKINLFADMSVATWLLPGDELGYVAEPEVSLGRRNLWDYKWKHYDETKHAFKNVVEALAASTATVNASGQITSLSGVSTTVSNAKITVESGKLVGIGTPNIQVDNALQEWIDVQNVEIDLSDPVTVIGNLAAGRIAAGIMAAEIVLAGSIHTAVTGPRFVIDSDSIRGYSDDTTVEVSIDSETGRLLAGGGVVRLGSRGAMIDPTGSGIWGRAKEYGLTFGYDYPEKLKGTSTTSTNASGATKSMTTQAGLGYAATDMIFVQSRGVPTIWMRGQVTSYAGTTIQFNVLARGTDTFTSRNDWDIEIDAADGSIWYEANGSAASGILHLENCSSRRNHNWVNVESNGPCIGSRGVKLAFDYKDGGSASGYIQISSTGPAATPTAEVSCPLSVNTGSAPPDGIALNVEGFWRGNEVAVATNSSGTVNSAGRGRYYNLQVNGSSKDVIFNLNPVPTLAGIDFYVKLTINHSGYTDCNASIRINGAPIGIEDKTTNNRYLISYWDGDWRVTLLAGTGA
jgi:hypothetical protein